jgi:hypothetical protein
MQLMPASAEARTAEALKRQLSRYQADPKSISLILVRRFGRNNRWRGKKKTDRVEPDCPDPFLFIM